MLYIVKILTKKKDAFESQESTISSPQSESAIQEEILISERKELSLKNSDGSVSVYAEVERHE